MRGRKITPTQKQEFIKALRQNGNITLAAELVALSRKVMYAERERDSGFAQQWDNAIDEACDRLEAEAWRRAVDGVEEPVIGRVGKDEDGIVTYVRKYSDTLMNTLLKAHKPEKYRERYDHTLQGNIAVKGYVTKDASPDAWDDDTTDTH